MVNSLPRRKSKKWDEGEGGELMQQAPHGAKAAATRQNEKEATDDDDRKWRQEATLSLPPFVHLYTVAQ